LDQGGEVQLTLARKATEVATPRQRIHLQPGRIGELQEEDAVTGDVGDASRIVAQRQRVKAVDAQAEGRVRGALDQVPRLAVGAHVSAPGQRLVRNAEVALRRPLGERAQLRRRVFGLRKCL
jgi:hypothetical protein